MATGVSDGGGRRLSPPGQARTPRVTRTRGVPDRSALEDVLDVLAGLLHVCLGLVVLALGLEVLVAGHPARGLLGLAADLLSCVADLVSDTHTHPFLSQPRPP